MTTKGRNISAGLMAAMTLSLALCVVNDLHAATDGEAQQILQTAGIQGGLIVQVGCGDGKLTAALRVNDGCLVHGLATDEKTLASARAHLQKLGLYGEVAVDLWAGGRLPYTDNLATLLVCEQPSLIPKEEILRVLAPGGVACLKAGGEWTRTVKPRPETIDEWTHYLHDASNNAVAQDRVVGPPEHLQWVGDPRWLRHHDHLSGLSAMVSAKGRLFFIVDLGPRWSVQMPPRWTLVACDAFNGVVLWQRPIEKWHVHLWPLKRGPATLMRRLVAEGDTVYVTRGVGAAVSALDAATGKTIREYEGTHGTEEILFADGVLYLVINDELDAYKGLPRDSVETIRKAGREWNWDERPRRLAAVEAGTGNALWAKQSRVAPVTLTASGRQVYFHDGDCVVCLEAKTGEQVWGSQPIPRWKPMHVLFGPTLVVHDDVVLFAGGEKMNPIRGSNDTMTALSAKTGQRLWSAPHPPSGYASSKDLFVIDGLVWCGVNTNRRDSGVFTGRDLHTGEVRREFPADDWPHMPHHRCHRGKATCNYILTSRTGIEFVDLANEHWDANHWVRGSCNYGIMPCNGLVYAPPHSCACYLLAKLNSFNALAPASPSLQVPRNISDEKRRQQGPASDILERMAVSQVREEARFSASKGSMATDWPTLRGNAARTGVSPMVVPTELGRLWQTDIGGLVSSPVIADGKVFLANIDRHAVVALDAQTGEELWCFTTGGRVDSPPTVWQGRILFGSADGFVYCLNAVDGQLAWRFQAAPVDRRLVAYGQVESVWPVSGSVLVQGDVLYCVAGRSMWLDSGLRLLRLDPRTGRKLSETVLDDKYPGTKDGLQTDIKWPNLPVALPDVLSSDGQYVYMRSQPFDLDGKRTDVITPRNYEKQRGTTAHLFCPTGFLDDSWWHRSYWLYGRSFISGAGGWYLASYQAPAGRILAVDGETIYGFGRAPLRFSGTPNTYHLFACGKQPDLVNPNPKQPPRRRGASIYGKVVPTRLTYQWSKGLPLMVRAMVATKDTLFIAGPPALAEEMDVYLRYGDPEMQATMAEHVAAFEGHKGAALLAVSKTDGNKQAAYRLQSAPRFDGLAAANGRLFLSTMDGKVCCLGAGAKESLPPAPDVDIVVPPTVTKGGFAPTSTHPDFQQLTGVMVTSSDLGYRLQTASREVGFALRKLEPPLTGRATFSVKVRPTPGATSPDKPGNAFLAFGDGPEDENLVKCGFRISGKRLFIVQGPLRKGKATKSAPVKVKADEVAELLVTVDLDSQTVTTTMLGITVEAPLQRSLKTIDWVGCCITSVTSDFGQIEIGE